MREIEIKIQIEKPDKLISFLKHEAKFIKSERQTDEYFSPIDRSFVKADPIREWLRLRSEKGKYFLTYKNWHYDERGRGHHCDEYESEISDIDDVRRILIALRFEPLITVDKVRESYRYKHYEISLDEVNQLGSYIEIESKRPIVDDPSKETSAMMEFIQQFEPGKVERAYRGYPMQLLELRAKAEPE